MNTKFYSLRFDPSGNRTSVYRFSSRHSIHLTTIQLKMIDRLKTLKIKKHPKYICTEFRVSLTYRFQDDSLQNLRSPQWRCHVKSNFLGTGISIFNRLRAIWPKGYQRGSLGQSHQNGDYLELVAMRKSYPPTRFEPAAFGLPIHCSTT